MHCKLQIANCKLQIEVGGDSSPGTMRTAGRSVFQFAICNLQFAICNFGFGPE